MDSFYAPFIDPTLYVLYRVKSCRHIHLIIPNGHQELFDHFLKQCTFFSTILLKLQPKCKCDSIYKNSICVQWFSGTSIVFSQEDFLELRAIKEVYIKRITMKQKYKWKDYHAWFSLQKTVEGLMRKVTMVWNEISTFLDLVIDLRKNHYTSSYMKRCVLMAEIWANCFL